MHNKAFGNDFGNTVYTQWIQMAWIRCWSRTVGQGGLSISEARAKSVTFPRARLQYDVLPLIDNASNFIHGKPGMSFIPVLTWSAACPLRCAVEWDFFRAGYLEGR
jgi:hypothetical protein